MIHDHAAWVSELQRNVSFLYEKKDQRIWRSQSYIALEKRLMISCYIIRKLYDSKHISKAEFNGLVKLNQYNSLGLKAPFQQSRKINEFYELETPRKIEKPLSFVVNQIIHSFSFVFVFKAKNEIEGFAFNSDKTKRDALFLVTFSELIDVLSPIAGIYMGETQLIQREDGAWEVLSEE